MKELLLEKKDCNPCPQKADVPFSIQAREKGDAFLRRG